MRLSAAPPYLAFTLVAVLAATCLAPACSSEPDTTDRDLARAQAAYQSDDLEQAEQAALAAWKTRPQSPEVRAMVASVYRKKGRTFEATQEAKEAWEAFRNAANYEPYRAKRARDYLAALNAGEFAGIPSVELVDVATGAVDADPANEDARRAAAKHLDNAGRSGDALPHYLWLFEAAPKDVRVALRLGTIYAAKGEHDDALVAYQRVLATEPGNVQAALGVATAQEAMGKIGRALSTYETLVEQHDANPGILFRFADFLERQGKNSRAERLRKQARESLPGVDRREMRDLR